MIRLHRSALNSLLFACITLLFAGCAAQRLHDEGLELLQQGKAEEGLRKLEQAAAAEPGNLQFRSDALARKYDAVKRLLSTAASQSAAGSATRPKRLTAKYCESTQATSAPGLAWMHWSAHAVLRRGLMKRRKRIARVTSKRLTRWR